MRRRRGDRPQGRGPASSIPTQLFTAPAIEPTACSARCTNAPPESGAAAGLGAGVSVWATGNCVELGWGTFCAAVVLAGFAVRACWRASPDLAATAGFGVFRAGAAVFAVGAGAAAAGARVGEGGAAAACAGALEGRAAASGVGAVAVSAFLGSGKAAAPTGSAGVWVAIGDAGAPTGWFAGPVSTRPATAGGVSACCGGASTSCAASPPEVAGGGLTGASSLEASCAGISALVVSCDGGWANPASASVEAPRADLNVAPKLHCPGRGGNSSDNDFPPKIQQPTSSRAGTPGRRGRPNPKAAASVPRRRDFDASARLGMRGPQWLRLRRESRGAA